MAIEAVSVALKGYSGGTSTDARGMFSLSVPADTPIVVAFSFVGFKSQQISLRLKSGEQRQINATLRPTAFSWREVVIESESTRGSTMQRLDPKLVDRLPSASGNFENILFTMPGVSSTSELSSAYNVRGGNFDENLIYVNGIEVYRPFLVRSGQQEGLSFVNPQMVSNILFSAGGWEPRYGDKMSSVLDINYKEPEKFGGSVALGLLGSQITLENRSKNYRFTQLHGFRYRTNQYLLRGLQTQGDYQPRFYDYQGYFTYDITDEWELGVLANYSKNQYRFVPETRETEFGNVNEALKLTVFFQGNEIDEYETGMGALTLGYRPDNATELKFITSIYRTVETETFDIEGAYSLDELDKDPASEQFNEVKYNRGAGGFIQHARNDLVANVFTLQHRGFTLFKGIKWDWGMRYNIEQIEDKFSEWEYQDSAGYSVTQDPGITEWVYTSPDSTQVQPVSPRSSIELREVRRNATEVYSQRLMGYAQAGKRFQLNRGELATVVGLRSNYWSYNTQILVSPRASVSYDPRWKRDWVFRAAWGLYHQPPFYREMRDLNGNINPDIKAQTSIHYVLGADYTFKLWQRPFKLTNELYYKDYRNLIPYEVDNVRMRYYATNNARGHSVGADARIYGEFVKGIESWASIGVMQTLEDLSDDSYTLYYNSNGEEIIQGYTFNSTAVDSQIFFPGQVPRPTDQRFRFGLYFQDYVPKIPSLKVNVQFQLATGLPFGPPSYERYKDTLRMPPYRRVDMGFSYDLLRANRVKKSTGVARHIREAWIAIEVFNMFGINNVISYLWIRDISGRRYGIPNYLTNRRINLSLHVRF